MNNYKFLFSCAFLRLGCKSKDKSMINSIPNWGTPVWQMPSIKSDVKKVLKHYIQGKISLRKFIRSTANYLMTSNIFIEHIRIWPAVLRQATYGTIKFGTYYTLKKLVTEKGWLIDNHGDERVWCNVLCAVIGQFGFSQYSIVHRELLKHLPYYWFPNSSGCN